MTGSSPQIHQIIQKILQPLKIVAPLSSLSNTIIND